VAHPEWKHLESADSLFLSFQHLFSPSASLDGAPEALQNGGKSALVRFGDSVLHTFRKLSDQARKGWEEAGGVVRMQRRDTAATRIASPRLVSA